MVREVDDVGEVRGKRHVRLDVLPMPADKTKVGGAVIMYDPQPEHQISSHRGPNAMEIEVARRLAWRMAHDHGADFIWIVDPKKLYPKTSRAVLQHLECAAR